uniref:Uncharacterized protein n=1 Tax=Arundo donax TaxID=35708 RepID=A0A0A8XR23_ARUDO
MHPVDYIHTPTKLMHLQWRNDLLVQSNKILHGYQPTVPMRCL